ncbi:MAG: hypothetical protein B7X64_08780 [Halothiobacillus sp. 39-53-45]|jgi:methyl-accepting chemotaxis protein|nr:MAG: hypothetical protein B7X64_08780 [Halothiobacillus sp. 39-53-45]
MYGLFNGGGIGVVNSGFSILFFIRNMSLNNQPVDNHVETKNIKREQSNLKLTVWVGMAAFLILAAYGFYLVFTLTQNVAHLDKSVGEIAQNMTEMTHAVTRNLDGMNTSFDAVARNMDAMQGNTAQLAQNLTEVTRTMQMMNQSMLSLRQDVGQMNQSVGRPLSFFSQFMPQSSPPPPYYYPARP